MEEAIKQTEQDAGLEPVISARLEALAAKAEMAIREATERKREKIKRRIMEILEFAARSFYCGVLFLSFVVAVESARSRYRVKEVRDKAGEIVFVHEDGRTTEILNYIAGRGKIGPELRATMLPSRAFLFLWANGDYSTSTRDLKAMGREELKDFIAHRLKSVINSPIREPYLIDKARKALAEIERAEDWTDVLFESSEDTVASRGLYEALWRIERDVGAPQIRFLDDNNRTFCDRAAYYNAVTNTMYLDPDELSYSQRAFLTEASHAVQASRGQIGNMFIWLRDSLKTIIVAAQTGKRFAVAYNELYGEPGTLEYEAHKLIEPELRARMEKARRN